MTGPMTEPLAASAPPERRSGPLHDLAAVDEAVYRAVAGLDTPSLDRGLRLLTTAANGSALWLGIAGAMVAFGGQRGRRATVRGLASIAITSAAVNQGLKALHRRSRPDRGEWAAGRHVPMPGSSSFPSGHSASGFAFASAVSVEYPLLALPLRGLAAAVAYSRVHTGVHYPGDAIAGALVGAAAGQSVARALDRRHRRRLDAPGRLSVG